MSPELLASRLHSPPPAPPPRAADVWVRIARPPGAIGETPLLPVPCKQGSPVASPLANCSPGASPFPVTIVAT